MVKHIDKSNFETEVLKEEKAVIVDFFATWCGPCKMLTPVLEEVEEEMKDIKVVKIDIDENKELAEEYGVTNIPTIKIFKGGEVRETKVGFQPKESLISIIKENI